ncbi:unnamed protein product, partial [Pleuronectes platessa]
QELLWKTLRRTGLHCTEDLMDVDSVDIFGIICNTGPCFQITIRKLRSAFREKGLRLRCQFHKITREVPPRTAE